MSDDPEPMSRSTFRWIAAGAAALALLLAEVKFGALWPYQLTRWVMCGAALSALLYVRGWRMFLAFSIALLYNPFDPVAFGSLWPKVNAMTVVAWMVLFPWGEAVNRRVRVFSDWFSSMPPGVKKADHVAILLVLIIMGFILFAAFKSYIHSGAIRH